MVKGKPTYTQS